MSRKDLLRYSVAAVAVAGIAGLAGDAAWAEPKSKSFTAEADVNILEPIGISETASLNFGKIIAPSTGSQTFTMATNGTETKGTGDGVIVEDGVPGDYDITGTSGQSYTFSVTAGTCSDATNLTLGSMTDDAGSTLDDLDVLVGGTLTVESGVSDGTATCAYTVAATY